MNIKIKLGDSNQEYLVTEEAARGLISAGVFKPVPKTRPIRYSDLKNGDVFKWKEESDDAWEDTEFVMVDKDKVGSGQVIRVKPAYSREWFSRDDSIVMFAVWDYGSAKWVGEMPA